MTPTRRTSVVTVVAANALGRTAHDMITSPVARRARGCDLGNKLGESLIDPIELLFKHDHKGSTTFRAGSLSAGICTDELCALLRARHDDVLDNLSDDVLLEGVNSVWVTADLLSDSGEQLLPMLPALPGPEISEPAPEITKACGFDDVGCANFMCEFFACVAHLG